MFLIKHAGYKKELFKAEMKESVKLTSLPQYKHGADRKKFFNKLCLLKYHVHLRF